MYRKLHIEMENYFKILFISQAVNNYPNAHISFKILPVNLQLLTEKYLPWSHVSSPNDDYFPLYVIVGSTHLWINTLHLSTLFHIVSLPNWYSTYQHINILSVFLGFPPCSMSDLVCLRSAHAACWLIKWRAWLLKVRVSGKIFFF